MFLDAEDNLVLSIAELAERVKLALNREFGPEGLWTRGVIASYSANASGHHYLDLQEFSEIGSAAPTAAVSCVLWKAKASYLLKVLEASPLGPIRNGLSLVVRVKPNFWPKGGRLTFQIEEIDIALSQVANLEEKEKIRQKLRQSGLWDFNRRLEVPLVPLRIGLITAQRSAAESDFIGELSRSRLAFELIYQPASTSGDGAPAQIVKSINSLQSRGVDIICLVRGGGSMTDLSVFDTEEVVSAVAACTIPVWVGVGHSTDRTLVEEVANRFLDVPQSVARAVVAQVQEFLDALSVLAQKVQLQSRARVELSRLQLEDIAHQLVRRPLEVVSDHSNRLVQSLERMKGVARIVVANSKAELNTRQEVVKITANNLVSTQVRELEVLIEVLLSSANNCIREQSKEIHVLMATQRIRSAEAIRSSRHFIEILEASSRASDPEEMAKRGFSLLASESGSLIRDVNEMSVGQKVKGAIGPGRFVATVDRIGSAGLSDG